MGNYNPSLPVILGQEWVPIRDENVTFAPSVNNVETGVGFTLATNSQASTGAYYSHALPASNSTAQATMLAVYAAGTEDQSGPIESVIIPVSSAATTGSGIQTFGFTVLECLSFSGDGKTLVFEYNGGTPQTLAMFFAVPDYAQLLAGKRILNVSYVYSGSARVQTGDGTPFINPTPTISTTLLSRRNNAGIDIDYLRFFAANTGSLYQLNTLVSAAAGVAEHTFGEVNLGDANVWYDNTLLPTAGLIYPWRYEELLKFGSAPTDRQFLSLLVQVPNLDEGSSNTQIWLDYSALRVTYCNERRVAYGGRYGASLYGVNVTPLKDVSFNNNPILTAGNYVQTMSMLNPGDISAGQGATTPSPDYNGLRQLYPIPPHPGVKVTIPYPLQDNLGVTFASEEVAVLPQLSLHTSGGAVLNDVHVYGRQVAAEVWGNVYAQQELLDTPVGSATSFPWVRFIARRFGDTTVPLTLTGQGGLAASTVSITPGEFDELPEILDGWKEISLQFSTPPSMGALGTPNWRWTATGETAGNRWEVLGASAPAISGVPGNLYNLAPAVRQLYAATYLQPTGATQDLEWVPQGVGTPYISGSGVSDDTSDAFLIFGQQPPDVSGFGVTTLCQPVTGIGQACDIDPCCIPSTLSFNQLTWSQVNTPASGFGYYEIQRSDTVDVDWLTIMQGTAITGTTFNDFEARVGIDTSYRIRSVDLYGFWGDWSDTITALITEPGVTIGCTGGHVLIFTSNERQSGALNLAYSSVWMESQVQEDFSFPEASFVQLQAMYDRDFFTAFRPLERGGEQFTRTVLVQAAAIDPETLADFRSLRDMAWSTVNYICVRDEDGNRWFATVGVPSGRVLNNRRLYLAPVQVAEVTDTPTPVDPADESVAGVVTAGFCDDFECDEIVAEDSFDRVEVGEWGEADVGGEWEEG